MRARIGNEPQIGEPLQQLAREERAFAVGDDDRDSAQCLHQRILGGKRLLMHRHLSRLAEARYGRVLLKNVEIVINDNYLHRRRLYRQVLRKRTIIARTWPNWRLRWDQSRA